MKKLLIISLLTVVCRSAFTQMSFIQNVVNSYYQVVEVIPGKSCVRLNTTSGLTYNNRVMLAQMKGATINTTTSSSAFGDTLSLNNAGDYEINTVCYINGDSVFLVYAFLNSYTAGGMVQLVKIPQYYSATVTDTLKAQPWNPATGTGGILAIIVEEDLILNAPIVANETGMKGGAYAASDGSCSNFFDANYYAYTGSFLTPQNGAYKGESITILASNMTGGRGAATNGGGGGNNHNNSGAGGSNLSRGGDGGGNSSGIGCNEAYVGIGGKAMSSYTGRKIFAGGGGGAGHSNNGTASTRGGGHGGGIIFIDTKNLIGNNKNITADGQLGGGSIGDGASGGGGGGTIIIKATNYTGNINITAKGGEGGLSNDGGTISRCYGGGGGGGGGVIYFSGSIPAGLHSVTGGAGGSEVGSAGTCGAQILGTPGEAGQFISNYTYRKASVLASYCAQVLAIKFTDFEAKIDNGITKLTWNAADPNLIQQFIIESSTDAVHWNRLDQMNATGNQWNYTSYDYSPGKGYNYYRILAIYNNGQNYYSSIERVFVEISSSGWYVYPNPAHDHIYIESKGTPMRGDIQLLDLSGKLLWQHRIATPESKLKIPLPALAKGIYMIRYGFEIQRLVIH